MLEQLIQTLLPRRRKSPNANTPYPCIHKSLHQKIKQENHEATKQRSDEATKRRSVAKSLTNTTIQPVTTRRSQNVADDVVVEVADNGYDTE